MNFMQIADYHLSYQERLLILSNVSHISPYNFSTEMYEQFVTKQTYFIFKRAPLAKERFDAHYAW